MQNIKDISINENQLHVLLELLGSKNSKKDYEFISDFENYCLLLFFAFYFMFSSQPWIVIVFMLCGQASEEGKGEWCYPSNSAVLFLAVLWDLRCGFRLRKIWISTHLMPKWALNPKRRVAPLTHFLCAECCDELIKSGLINQTTLKVYVGYPCSSMKYQEVMCLSSTCFAKPETCGDVWQFRSCT